MIGAQVKASIEMVQKGKVAHDRAIVGGTFTILEVTLYVH